MYLSFGIYGFFDLIKITRIFSPPQDMHPDAGDRSWHTHAGANVDLLREKIYMCRQKKTRPQVTAMAFASMLLFCQHAGAEQGEPKYVELGYQAEAFGTGAVAIGWGATARGKGSIAIGSKGEVIGLHGTSAANGGIAIGDGSESHINGDVNFGSRTLSGLRDGVSDDEAVTMRQMKAAQAYTDLSKTQAIAAANAYSDAVKNETIAQGKKHVEQIIAAGRAQHDTKLLSLARSYSDRQNQAMLENANAYSEKVGRNVLSSANAFTELRSRQAQDNAVALSRQYTDRRVGQLESQIKKFRRRANAGISGAMAMTTLTPPPANANTSFGMAMATYRSQVALASGVTFRMGKSSNLRLNTSWDSAGGIGAAAGFNVAW